MEVYVKNQKLLKNKFTKVFTNVKINITIVLIIKNLLLILVQNIINL